jgi:hypothetical protein
MTVPADLLRRLDRLEAIAIARTMTAAPAAEDLAAVAAIEAETGRPIADLAIEEILRTEAFRSNEREYLERVAAATAPEARRA